MLQKPEVEIVKMVIRVPLEIREQIRSVAIESRRSMNSEVVHRLESSLKLVDKKCANRS